MTGPALSRPSLPTSIIFRTVAFYNLSNKDVISCVVKFRGGKRCNPEACDMKRRRLGGQEVKEYDALE